MLTKLVSMAQIARPAQGLRRAPARISPRCGPFVASRRTIQIGTLGGTAALHDVDENKRIQNRRREWGVIQGSLLQRLADGFQFLPAFFRGFGIRHIESLE